MRSPFLQDRFSTVPLFAYTHLGASAIALMAGPFQLNSRLRGRYLSLHRRLGRLYVICVMLGGVAGFLFATMSEGGFVAHFGFALLAVLWLLTAGAAYSCIRARDEVAHRRWMTRSFALTFAAVTLRIYIPLSSLREASLSRQLRPGGLTSSAALDSLVHVCTTANSTVSYSQAWDTADIIPFPSAQSR